MLKIEIEVNQIVKWLQEKVYASGSQGIIFGLSGGIDSCLVGALAKKAFPDQCLGVIMPCHSNEEDRSHALLMATNFAIPTKEINLSPVFDSFVDQLSIPTQQINTTNMSIANIKPRLRMTTLYYYASTFSYLVAGTGNRSEAYIGYCTKYGDLGADILPIAHLVKHQVKEMSDYLGIPKEIITKPPSAGLWSGQTDEGEMGFTYEQLDKFILTGEGDDPVKEKIMTMHRKSNHKRSLPPKIEQ